MGHLGLLRLRWMAYQPVRVSRGDSPYLVGISWGQSPRQGELLRFLAFS